MRKVLLINWDNYPNVASGGVYSWEKTFVERMEDCEFFIVNQLSNSNANAIYSLPKNVKSVLTVPIFGTNRYEEFSDEKGEFISKILHTTNSVVKLEFLPLFEEFLKNILDDSCNPYKIRDSVLGLHSFLTKHDSKKCFENHAAFEAFLKQVSANSLYNDMELKEAIRAFQSLQRGLQVIAIEVPRVDLIHCSLAWLPSLAAVCAKKKYGVPILITEHGVAYRELLLTYHMSIHDQASIRFWKRIAVNIISTLYSEADAIVPVCSSNSVWEVMMGADKSKINVIHNGIDTNKFRPMTIERSSKRPTVVSVARIDVWKDILNLIHSIDFARQTIPDLECLLFGESVDLDYAQKCAALMKELQLEDNFRFMGRTSEPEKAYNMGDLVVFSGITEGFPFSIIEAMACGKAIVAADVGGVSEALEGCGILVRSMSPRDLANDITRLLRDPELRNELGGAAMRKAQEKFAIEVSVSKYRNLYDKLLSIRVPPVSEKETAQIVVTH